MESYKKRVELSVRKEKANYILHKYYPGKVPVVVQKYKNDDNLPNINQEKYLVPSDMIYSTFMLIIRKRMEYPIEPSMAIYLMTGNGKMMSSNNTFLNIYDTYKDKDDGLLYLYYTGENTFG